MTQKLFNINKWTRLMAGNQLDLPGDRLRLVRLHVNTPAETHLSYISDDGEVLFLAAVYGRDTVEFMTDGRVSILTDTDDTFIYTADGEQVHQIVEAPESFTRIMEKRARNPELERIAALMNQNMSMRLQAQAAEYEGILERRFAAREALLKAEGAASGDAVEPDADAEAGRPVGETA